MSGADAQLLDGVRSWLGEGPGARRLALAAEPAPRVLYAPGLAAVGLAAVGLAAVGLTESGLAGSTLAGSTLAEGGDAATVIALDGTVPIGIDELAMLTEIPAPPAAVVFALVGGEDTAVRERNRALLAAFAPGLDAAPMVPAWRGGELAEAVASAEDRMRGRDRVSEIAASAVDFEAGRQHRRLRALRRHSEFDTLRAERAAMLRSRHGAQGQGGAAGGLPAQLAGLRAAFGLARVDLGHEISGRCRHLASTVRLELDVATKTDLRGFPNRLRDALAALDDDLDREIIGRLSSVAPAQEPGRPEGPVAAIDEPRGRTLTFDDRLMIVMGASGGLGIGRLLTSPLQVVGVPEVLSVPIMLVLGALLVWWIVRARANAGDRQRMRQWASDAIAESKARWDRILAQRALDAEAAAVGALGEEHARDVQRTDLRLAELEARLARMGREREGKVQAVTARLAQAARFQAALAPHVLCSVKMDRPDNYDHAGSFDRAEDREAIHDVDVR